MREETGDDGMGEQRKLDARTPGFATAIDLEQEPGARPSDALPELLSRTPGATVRSLGGLGQFSSVSLRGSSGQQVQVAMDGVPINSGLAGLVDVGSLPLDGLDRVEVYRGHVPVSFGGATIGGAINLVSRPVGEQATVHARGGMGSFGAREARMGASVPLPRGLGFATHVGYAGASGNFRFYDTANTPQVPDDDVTSTRLNNDYDRLMAQLRLDGEHRAWRWSVRPMLVWKRQGVPGPATAQSLDASLDTVDARAILRAQRRRFGHPAGRLAWLGSVGVQRRRFADPRNEVGLGVDDQQTLAVDGYLSPRLRLALWRGAFLRITADQRTEHVDVDERSNQATDPSMGGERSGDARRLRLAWGAGLELEQFLFDRRWLIVPVFRADALDSRFAVAADEGEQDDQGRDALTFGLSPRLGTRVRIVEGLELRASGGRYFRPPTLLELFGDRGYVIGNEGLSAERGNSIDGGLRYDRVFERESGVSTSVYASAAGFATWSEDLIQWVTTGNVVQPVNIEGARVAGLEGSLSVRALHNAIVLDANYTLLDTVNLGPDPEQNGSPLPGRPRHQIFGAFSTGWEWTRKAFEVEPRLRYTIDVASGTFLDPSARQEVPTRVIHGIGAELHLARTVHLGFELRNLLDTRVTTWTPPIENAEPLPVPLSDFIGYPLPGRSLWATVRIDLAVPDREDPR